MAEKKENAASEVKKNNAEKSAKKKGNPFKKAGKAIKEFFKNFKGECKKITWPSGKTVVNSSLVVIAVVAIVGIVIFAFDTGISEALKAVIRLANEHKEAKQAAEQATQAVANVILPMIMG